jgi:hypothetical protein
MQSGFAAVSIIALALFAAFWRSAIGSTAVTEYAAVYDVSYRNFSGTGEFGVHAEGDGEYVFESSVRMKGIIVRTLVGSNPAVEHSRFTVSGGRIAPAYFRYEDGTRNGEDNFEINFEAADSEIRVSGPEISANLTYEQDLLDRGSLQVALMRDLAACESPGPYRYVDDDGITTYDYRQLEDRTTETGIGTLATVRFTQQREGSGRETILWLAPEYAYVPVRIERFDDGELEWAFVLEELEGVARTSAACSGFR